MAMALKTLNFNNYFSLFPCSHHHYAIKPSTPLFSLRFSSPPSASSSPIFLPHLENSQSHSQSLEARELENEEPESESESQTEEELDPILDFLKSRSPTAKDPKTEGRVAFQRNRRTAWHLADYYEQEIQEDGEEFTEFDSNSTKKEEISDADGSSGGVCSEILREVRNLRENSTVAELLNSYSGKLTEGNCIELLKRMGGEETRLRKRSILYLFEWMRVQDPPLITPRSCSVLFPILGRAGLGKELMVLFENLPKAKRFRNVCVYNAAISGLSCSQRYDDAWKVYEAMELDKVRPDHITCSILIATMRKHGRSAKDAWDFFERMNKKGVKWSLEIVGALIKCFCDEGLKKEALVILSQMEEKGLSPNVIIYNTLMDAYNKSNQIEEAEGLFVEMKEKGINPTTASYNILMDAYSKRIQPDIAENLLAEMQSFNLKPDVKSYTCLISAYGRQRKMSDKAADSFLRMKKAGLKPTSYSYTALIHAYSVDGWHEKAYRAYENMKSEDIEPSIETYTALLDAFRRAGDTQMLLEIWKSMMSSKVEGTRVTFNIILDGLAKHGLYVQARDVIFEFGKLGLGPTVMTYNMLMNAYARGGQHSKLPQLLKEMATLDLKPDPVTYLTMIYAYVRVREFTKAFYYHKQMVKSGQVPDARAYQKLRAILDEKAATKNTRDRSAILGIVNSKFGLKPKKGKKDEFWKTRKRRSMINKLISD